MAPSKKTSLLVLAITALVFSRTLFSLFNDPEGPNLLVVTGMALIIYLLSLAAYAATRSFTGPKRLLLTIAVQVLVVAVFYFCLN